MRSGGRLAVTFSINLVRGRLASCSRMRCRPLHVAAAGVHWQQRHLGVAQANIGKQWSYYSFDDDMNAGQIRQATVTSTTSFTLDFPYNGPQHASLRLRRHPRWGSDVILSVDKGQMLCSSYRGCPICVRFDDAAAVTYNGTEPSDNSSDTIFIPGFDRFSSKLQKAKTVRIEVEFYRQGNRVLEF